MATAAAIISSISKSLELVSAVANETLAFVAGLAAGESPAAKPAKVSKAKAPKEEKTSVARKPALHPTYLAMISDAITALKERNGSSQYAISKFVEGKHKGNLPANFKKLLLVRLRKLTAAGKLTKIKNSYKISAKTKLAAAKEKSVAAKTETTDAKKKKVVVKPKEKSVAAKPETADSKMKKVVVKPKPKSATVRTKAMPAALRTVAKSKRAAPKPKTADHLVKTPKSSAKAASGKKPAPTSVKKPKSLKSGKVAPGEK